MTRILTKRERKEVLPFFSGINIMINIVFKPKYLMCNRHQGNGSREPEQGRRVR